MTEATRGEVSEATWAKYDQATRLFLNSIGGRADHDLGTIRKDDIARFRDEQGRRVAEPLRCYRGFESLPHRFPSRQR
jgi:hypothetical protein